MSKSWQEDGVWMHKNSVGRKVMTGADKAKRKKLLDNQREADDDLKAIESWARQNCTNAGCPDLRKLAQHLDAKARNAEPVRSK